jgi:hypothetical protein
LRVTPASLKQVEQTTIHNEARIAARACIASATHPRTWRAPPAEHPESGPDWIRTGLSTFDVSCFLHASRYPLRSQHSYRMLRLSKAAPTNDGKAKAIRNGPGPDARVSTRQPGDAPIRRWKIR